MSRRSYHLEMRRGIGRFAFSILGGLLLASQLVLPSTTFALSTRTMTSADPPASQSFALSEVSVVRLVYSYSAKPAAKGTTAGNPVLCTSVGVLVKSFPASTPSASQYLGLNGWQPPEHSPCPLCSGWFEFARENIDNLYPVVHQCVCQQCIYRQYLYTCFARYHIPLLLMVTLCFATPCTNGAFFFSFHTDQLQPTLDCGYSEYTPAVWHCTDLSSLSDGSSTSATSKYSSGSSISHSHCGHTWCRQ